MQDPNWKTKFKQWVGLRDSHTPMIIPRSQHDLSRKLLSPNAVRVLYRLHKAGYAAYIVGGGVRDVLVGRQVKDFDVATNATPEQVNKVFNNSRVIGRRFRLVHVYYPNEIIEVSTFRANMEDQRASEAGDDEDDDPGFLAENTYGTIEEDAWRRDFTVNALYYNIADFSIEDFTGGMRDLKRRMICVIGDPVQRYHEDPVRLLRALRLAAKLDFSIHKKNG